MKREVERQRRLPAFSLSIGELEALVDRLLALFDDPSRVKLTIDIQLPSEHLQFSSVQELREYKSLPPQLKSFSLWLWHATGRLWLRSARPPFIPAAEVSATAESEAWCAGAIDTVHSFVAGRKAWYHWFVSAPIGPLLLGLANLPTVAALLPSGYKLGRVALLAWVVAFLALLLLYFGRGTVFPSSLIRLRESDGFIKKHVAELSLAIALVSAVLTVVGWFVAK